MCIYAYHFTTDLSLLLLPCIITLFLHLLSTNHKCTQPCYFSLLYKSVARKVKMVMKNSSMRSSRLSAVPVDVPVVLWSLPLFRFIIKSSYSLEILFI
jgi:hypothetical protein